MPTRLPNSYVAQALYANPDIYIPTDTNDGRVQGVYITVSGDAIVGTDLTVNNDLHVINDFTVDGATVINGDEAVTGTLTVNNLTVVNESTIGGTMTVTGLLTATGGVTVGGLFTTTTLSATNDITVGNDLTVTGQLIANGGETINGTLTVDDITVSNNATIEHDVTITGDLTVNGNQTLTGTLTLDDLTVDGVFTVNGTGSASRYIVSGPNNIISITNANIGDLNGTGIQLVPPQGANKIPMISYILFRYIPNGTPYVLGAADQYMTVGFGNFGVTTDITCNAYVGEITTLDGFIGFNGVPGALVDAFKILRNPSFIGITPELTDELVPSANFNLAASSAILFSDSTIVGLGGELRVYVWYDSFDITRTS